MLKLFGTVVLILSTSMVGVHFSGRLSERVRMLNAIKLMLEDISIHIRFRGLTVTELVQNLVRNPSMSECTFLLTVEENLKVTRSFSEAWNLSIDACNIHCLKPSDREFLMEIGGFLGNSDIDGQLSSLELSKEKLRMLQQSAIEQCDKKGRLYRSLGVLSGAFAAVMLF